MVGEEEANWPAKLKVLVLQKRGNSARIAGRLVQILTRDLEIEPHLPCHLPVYRGPLRHIYCDLVHSNVEIS